MRVLVTGAAGFIGSHTVVELLGRDHSVIGMDNFNDYYSPQRKRLNVEEIVEAGGDFRFFEGDIRDREFLGKLFREERLEAVVNLAAMAGVRASIDNPHLYVDVNLTGSLNLMMECVEHGVGNYVLASTSSAYGNTNVLPFVEHDPCDRPLAPYAASKRAAEMMAYTYHHLFGLNATVLRFFTVYGPRGRPDMMTYKVLDNLFFDVPCPLFNGGEMWRDWTYVGDIARGVASAAERPLGYEIINLGRGEMIKLADFIATLERLAGRQTRLESAPKSAADIDRSFASIDKAQRLLDYRPQVSLQEGVELFLDWYRRAVLEE